jgi:sterol desaturase/sphingolipid hydroxylase (fatty acid hydroxylase superfamily)
LSTVRPDGAGRRVDAAQTDAAAEFPLQVILSCLVTSDYMGILARGYTRFPVVSHKSDMKQRAPIYRQVFDLFKQDGRIRPGTGMISGVIALFLAILAVLGVLAFHFPAYLTTPELRSFYSVDAMRALLFGALLASGTIALANTVLGRQRWLNIAAFVLVCGAVAAGGSNVVVTTSNTGNHPYLGLDWFILDLLASSTVFIIFEKLFPLYPGQPVFRMDWQVDMKHFLFNHLSVGAVLLCINFFVHRLFSWAAYEPLQQAIVSLPYLAELFLAVLVADLVQYAAHRAYHEVPFLWRIHAVHHSTRTLDWLAGSRLHIVELLITRVAVLGVLFALGFSKSVLDAYIIIVGFQAVLIHSNVKLPWGWLRYVIVTPDFHHWHHSSDTEAIDRNYAAHLSFIDYLFGTAVRGVRNRLPEHYGILDNDMPGTFLAQQAYPFARKK